MTQLTQTPAEKARERAERRRAVGRAIGFDKLAEVMAAGNTIRRGTVLRGAFAEWVWQVFDADGQIIHLARWDAVQKWTKEHGKDAVSDLPGVSL